jgi:two-component system response regulator AtoC
LAAQQKILALILRPRSRRLPRVVAAASEELEHALRARRMNEDFCHAIGSVCLRVPPLRARREDVLLLSEHFLRRYARIFARPKPTPSPEAVEFFLTYRWPGNIAELETAMKSLVAIGDERVVLEALRASAWTGRPKAGFENSSLKQTARAASLEAERELISEVLVSTNWNRKRAAERLQISYKALLYKMKRIEIGPPAVQRTNGE